MNIIIHAIKNIQNKLKFLLIINIICEKINEIIQNCNDEDFFNNQCKIEISNSEGIDNIISNIETY